MYIIRIRIDTRTKSDEIQMRDGTGVQYSIYNIPCTKIWICITLHFRKEGKNNMYMKDTWFSVEPVFLLPQWFGFHFLSSAIFSCCQLDSSPHFFVPSREIHWSISIEMLKRWPRAFYNCDVILLCLYRYVYCGLHAKKHIPLHARLGSTKERRKNDLRKAVWGLKASNWCQAIGSNLWMWYSSDGNNHLFWTFLLSVHSKKCTRICNRLGCLAENNGQLMLFNEGSTRCDL